MAYDPKRTRPDKAAATDGDDDETQIDALLDRDDSDASGDDGTTLPSAPVAVPPPVLAAPATNAQRFGVVAGVAAATVAALGIIALIRRRRRRRN